LFREMARSRLKNADSRYSSRAGHRFVPLKTLDRKKKDSRPLVLFPENLAANQLVSEAKLHSCRRREPEAGTIGRGNKS